MQRLSFRNWAGTHERTPKKLLYPASLAQLQAILRAAKRDGQHVRVFGAGHSPSDIACSDDVMLNLDRLSRLHFVDSATKTCKVDGGIRIHDLLAVLRQFGLRLAQLGSITDQSIAGLLSTASHGTGIDIPMIGDAVLEIELVCADGTVLKCSRANDPDVFSAVLCSFGTLGIIVTVTLQLVDNKLIRARQQVMPLPAVLAGLNDLLKQSQHMRFWLFTPGQDCVVWHADSVDEIEPTAGHELVFSKRRWVNDKLFGFHLLQLCYYVATFFPRILPALSWMYVGAVALVFAHVFDFANLIASCVWFIIGDDSLAAQRKF
eukprot:TRINITY_DN1315_c0_g1_i1.p1 TRINITY_DN1315_c0_g1~~TRINITY_DN1315_c0_g1_i1.p1  ORF type:complete len:319 (-),score=35.12 TRINITY_DN1315_c0_g1_i1:552-1508(-)